MCLCRLVAGFNRRFQSSNFERAKLMHLFGSLLFDFLYLTIESTDIYFLFATNARTSTAQEDNPLPGLIPYLLIILYTDYERHDNIKLFCHLLYDWSVLFKFRNQRKFGFISYFATYVSKNTIVFLLCFFQVSDLIFAPFYILV